jgi:hypothetical protein
VSAAAGRVGFFTQNGIGLGHLRRALLLAQELRRIAPEVEPLIVSQAATTQLLAAADVPAVNLPLLHRLPSTTIDRALFRMLGSLLRRLELDLVVEDTEPDGRLRRIPSYTEVPSVFVLRRVDGLGFDRLRTAGAFTRARRVLVAAPLERLLAEEHTAASRLGLRWSRRFVPVGDVYGVARAGTATCPGDGRVVVNAGAGGDHFDEAYCDRLFRTATIVAKRLPAVPFTFVLGPYYAGTAHGVGSNVEVLGFADDLPERLARARAAVVRPGHNVLREALVGGAAVAIVPGVAHMESHEEEARRAAADHPGVAVVDVDDADALTRFVARAVANGAPYRRRLPPPGQERAARLIAAELAEVRAATTVPLRPPAFAALAPPRGLDLPDARLPCVPGLDEGAGATAVVAAVSELGRFSLRSPAAEIVLAYDDRERLTDWQARFRPEQAGVFPVAVERIGCGPGAPQRLAAHVARTIADGRVPSVVLDAREEPEPERAEAVAREVAGMLERLGVRLLSIEELASIVVDELCFRPS